MNPDNAVPLTPEFVKGEMLRFLREELYRAISGALIAPKKSREDLAKCFTTALFNKAEQLEEGGDITVPKCHV